MAGTGMTDNSGGASRAAVLFERVAPMLPGWMKRWIRRAYYARVVRNFEASRWPGAEVLKRLVAPGDVVFDIGANIGYTTKLMAGWVTPSGRVISFEPIPGTFDILRHVVLALDLRNVEPVNAALSSRAGEAAMVVPKTVAGTDNIYESHIVGAEGGGDGGATKVRVDTVDRVARDLSGVRLMKIDVEGHEFDVLRGALETLTRFKPGLFVEINSNPDDPASDAAKVFRLLGDLGYQAFIVEGSLARPRPVGYSATDYLFLADEADVIKATA